MQLFENYESDNSDFHKIPPRIENYDQAKQIYEMILKLVKQREKIDQMENLDDTVLFKGLAYSSYADFLSNSDEIYRLSEKSAEMLVKSLQGNDKKHCDHEMG